jgi:hypothetical protein
LKRLPFDDEPALPDRFFGNARSSNSIADEDAGCGCSSGMEGAPMLLSQINSL